MLDRKTKSICKCTVYSIILMVKFQVYEKLSKFAEQTYWEPRHASQSHSISK